MITVQSAQSIEWPHTWEGAETFARSLTDRLGCPIDPGILETVVTLNLLGFRTSQSCEGHYDEGYPYPWIDFQTGECPTWYEQGQEEISREGLSEAEQEVAIDHLMNLVAAYHHVDHPYTRLSVFLDTFYATRADVHEDWRIILHCVHPGYYRMFDV